MNILNRYVSTFINSVHHLTPIMLKRAANYHSFTPNTGSSLRPGGLFNLVVRNKGVRVYFPRPCERKRIKRHGWQTRMSTPEGRRIIMNRILKGKFVLTH